jgi:D-glycero-D-manno-heptose 1,7-bisphosphate phosphatase
MNKAVFLDRDGVISKVILKDGIPFSARKFEEFKLFTHVQEVLEGLKEQGFLNIIITNQPDIARGLMCQKELKKMHDLVRKSLPVDDIVVCPHDDSDNCNCRKPKCGMLLYEANKKNIDLANSFIIGDQWKDIEAGKAAGCTTVLIDYPYNQNVASDFRVKDLVSAGEVIKKTQRDIEYG